MSDISQGPGWWQASDGKWYPPEQAPGYQAPPPGIPPYGGAPYGGAPTGGAPGNIDVAAGLQWAVAKFQLNIQPLIILGLIAGGIPFLLTLAGAFAGGFTGTAIQIAGSIASLVLSMLLVQAGLEIASTGSLNQSAMFQFRANPGQYIIGAILFGILQILGICPGMCIGFLFVWLIFGMWSFLIVDRGAGAIDSLTGSKDVTMGPGLGTTFLPMLVYLVLMSIHNIGLGFIFGGIIVIVTAPFAALYGAWVFKNLTGQPFVA